MYEKILQKLKTQRGTTSNVSDRTLEDLAKSLESIISTDELLEKAELTKAIESVDGNINHYTAKQVEEAKSKAIKDLEEQKKKEQEDVVKKAADEKAKKELDNMPEWAKALIEQNKAIADQMNGIKKEKVTQSRGEILTKKLEGTPDIFKNATLKSFNRMKFENDEDFNEYVTEIETSSKEAIQIARESGLNITAPKGQVKKPDPEEVTPEMQKAIEKVTKPQEVKGKF